MIDYLLPLIVGFVALVAIAALLGRKAGPSARVERKPFLTENEARVLGLLEAALPNHRVMAQVAMGALLKSSATDRKRAHAARNSFSQKIVDFVVVTRDSAKVVALIELDDRTHRAAKDASRDAMTASAGYLTIRIPSRPRPTLESVRAALASVTLKETS